MTESQTTARALTIRQYRPDDLPSLLALLAATEGHAPSEEEFTTWEAKRDPNHFLLRLLAEDDGRLLGMLEVQQTGFTLPGMLEWEMRLHPQAEREPIADALADLADREISRVGPITVEGRAPDSDPAARAWFERHGFRFLAHRLESRLDLTTLDEDAYRAGIARAEAAGYAFPSLSQYLESAGADAAWQGIVPLYQQLVNDTPDFAGRQMPASAVLARTRDFPFLHADATTLVERDGELVGLTFVWRWDDEGYTVMTGIKLSERGRGAAYAMKALAALRARDAGMTGLGTHNDASNQKVLALNARLGYARNGGLYRMHKSYPA